MTILLTGGSGQVGRALAPLLARLEPVEAPSHAAFDLGMPNKLVAFVADLRPSLIVNCAAYTAVDAAEDDAERAALINAAAPGTLAVAARRLGIPIIHFSTDYVFDGYSRLESGYRESDSTDPLSVYGRTKLAGERAVAASGAPHLILRTSWVYDAEGKNFLNTIRRAAQVNERLRVVSDQIGAPTWSVAIAEAVHEILASRRRGTDYEIGPVSGLYHLSAAGRTSWHGFAQEILRLSGDDPARVDAITTADWPTKAARPLWSLLDTTRLRTVFGVTLAPWQDFLPSASRLGAQTRFLHPHARQLSISAGFALFDAG